MQIDIAASAVIRGQMKNDVAARHGLTADVGIQQIGLEEFDSSIIEVRLEIGQLAARKIVDHAHFRSALHQRIHQRGTNE